MTRMALRKELVALVRDGRMAALLLVGLLVLSAVGFDAATRLRAQAQERAAIEQVVRQQWDTQGDKHPHRGAHFGLYALRPLGPLAVFEPGLSPFTGPAIWLEPHRRNPPRFSPAADDPPGARLARLSPAWAAAVLVPLLVLGITFASITQERESGTLRMLHGLGFSPATLAWSKWTAAAAALAVLLLATAAPIAVLTWESASAEDLLRAAVVAAAVLAYWLGFAGLAVGVSARCSSSRTALVVLVLVWMAVALALPRASAAFAHARVTLPSADAFWAAIKNDYEQGLPGDGDLASRVRRFETQILAQYGVARLEDLPVGINPLRRLQRDAYADRVHELHFGRLWDLLEHQQRMVRMAGVVSPTVALDAITTHLSGTALAHQRHFEQAAEAYRRDVNTRIDLWEARNTRGVTSFEERFAGDALWQSIPAFSYRAPPLAEDLRAAALPLVLLAAWLGGTVLFMLHAARRLAP